MNYIEINMNVKNALFGTAAAASYEKKVKTGGTRLVLIFHIMAQWSSLFTHLKYCHLIPNSSPM